MARSSKITIYRSSIHGAAKAAPASSQKNGYKRNAYRVVRVPADTRYSITPQGRALLIRMEASTRENNRRAN